MEMKAAVFVLRTGGIPLSLSAAAGSLLYYTASLQQEVGRRRDACIARVRASLPKSATPSEARSWYFVMYDVYAPPQWFARFAKLYAVPSWPRLDRDPGVAVETRRWLALSDHALFCQALALYVTAAAFCAWGDFRSYRSLSPADLAAFFIRKPWPLSHIRPKGLFVLPVLMPLYNNFITGGDLTRLFALRRPPL